MAMLVEVVSFLGFMVFSFFFLCVQMRIRVLNDEKHLKIWALLSHNWNKKQVFEGNEKSGKQREIFPHTQVETLLVDTWEKQFQMESQEKKAVWNEEEKAA